ncbi:MAG: DUF599 domain-containing protein [Thiotrichaceae bacterium]
MNETYFFIAGICILLTYHAFLWYRLTYQPLNTSIGRGRVLRAKWVETMMLGKKDIIAVQTLRNWTMSASFLASTAIVVGLGILNFILTTEKLSESSQHLNFIENTDKTLWIIKLMLLSADFFFAFFSFALTIRHYNHVGFLINVPISEYLTVESVVKAMNQGAGYYSWGMRGYYLSIPLTLWLFGSHWFFIGSLLLVFMLYHLDKYEDA